MYDNILDTVREAAESTIRFQQQVFRPWLTAMTPPVGGTDRSAKVPDVKEMAEVVEAVHDFQKDLGEFVMGVVQKQRAFVDAEFGFAIQMYEDIFEVAQAKDAPTFQASTERLWKDYMTGAIGLVQTRVEDASETYRDLIELVGRARLVPPMRVPAALSAPVAKVAPTRGRKRA
jgi:hypothetical protein